jgi:hypothetical protein
MNINKILREAKVTHKGNTVIVSFSYPHAKLIGYDCKGCGIKQIEMRAFETVGMTVNEAKNKARNVLKVEKIEARINVKSSDKSEIWYTLKNQGARV